jgi:hypothetical protein
MKLQNLLIFPLILLSGIMCNAQTDKKQDFFIVGKKDTTFCKKLSMGVTGQGYLNRLEYTDLKGKEVKLKGRSDVPDVTTLCINGKLIDRVPQKPNKPEGYVTFISRAVDGKLIVYLEGTTYSSTMQSQIGSYRFFLKMPDGTYYRINDSGNIKKYIKPYLMKCKEFADQYKGDFDTEEKPFMETVKLYNSLCK